MQRLSDIAGAQGELLLNLTLRDLRGRYRRSILGWAWSLLNPLATILVFSVVFRVLLKFPVERGEPSGLQNFPLFLVTGLLAWNLFSTGLTGSMATLLGNSVLIKRVYFPRQILILSSVGSAVVTVIIELAVVAVVLMLAGNFVLPWLPVVLLLLAVQTMFVAGVAMALSVLNVYFRDLEYAIGILLQVLFYSIPLIYPVSLIPVRGELLGVSVPVRSIYLLNPLVRFVQAFRDCLYDLRFPPLSDWVYLVAVSAATLALGLAVFNRFNRRLAEEL